MQPVTVLPPIPLSSAGHDRSCPPPASLRTGARPLLCRPLQVRKNKADNVDEEDMDVVVKIHNEMNERAWRKLLEWESLHAGCVRPPARARTHAPPLRRHSLLSICAGLA